MSERQIVCGDLSLALDALRGQGFRLDVIYPADEPHTAVLTRGDELTRLTTQPDAPPLAGELAPFAPAFVLTKAGPEGVRGRAGMLYRDLIPGRLGGRYIASHITIPAGGPVSDWVHFHRIALQIIYVRRGWVRVAYEDQGEPFVMAAGDMVLQPPLIRHRVLESSPGLEVIEVTAPALHETFADHELALPNGTPTGRSFSPQHFLRHDARATPWTDSNGVEVQNTAMSSATAGVASVRTLRPGKSSEVRFAGSDGELVFGFVLEGRATLACEGAHTLGPADAFVIPPAQEWGLAAMSGDLRLLQITTARLDGAAPSHL